MLLLRRSPAGLLPVGLVLFFVVGLQFSSPDEAGLPVAGLVEQPPGARPLGSAAKDTNRDIIDFDSLVVEYHANGARSVDLEGYTSRLVVSVDEDGTIHEACVSSVDPHDHAAGKEGQ